MRKKNKPLGQKGPPDWIGTYGDMVTLLLTFFILLFSMSTIDAQKFKELSQSLESALGDRPSSNGLIDGSTNSIKPAIKPDTYPKDAPETKKDMDQLHKELTNLVDQAGLSSSTEVIHNGTKVSIRFKDYVLFDSGEAILKKEASSILVLLGSILKEQQDILIGVEGHSDDRPISNHKFPSNWELSSIRAINILHYFVEKCNIDPMILSAIGRGEFRPVASNTTEEGRAKNRRVEITIESIQ